MKFQFLESIVILKSNLILYKDGDGWLVVLRFSLFHFGLCVWWVFVVGFLCVFGFFVCFGGGFFLHAL